MREQPTAHAQVIGDVAVVTLIGEHDLATEADVGRVLGSMVATGLDVLVDVSRVSFLDCSICHALGDHISEARRRGRRTCLQLGSERIVERVLSITRLLDLLPVYRTREEALRALSGGQGPSRAAEEAAV